METGKKTEVGRRGFLGASALASAAGLLPSALRAQTASAAGVKPADLPDLTIKAVKVYATASGRLASITAASGVEGICTLQTRVFHANWDNSGWLSYAQRTLIGKNALDHLQFTSQYSPVRRHYGQPPEDAGIDICLWDLIGKAVGLPVYRVLGAY